MADQFIDMLLRMRSNDNDVRKSAESSFFRTKDDQPNETLQALLQIARSHVDAEMRTYCYLLLRNMFRMVPDKTPLFLGLNEETKRIFQVELLSGIEREEQEYVRKTMCDVVSDIATTLYSYHQSWDELVQWCVTAGQSDNSKLNQSCFEIFKEIAGYLMEVTSVKSSFPVFVQILHNGLNHNEVNVKIEALYALETFVQYSKHSRELLQNLIDPMFQTISYCLDNRKEKECEKCIEVFIDLGALDPSFFKPKINIITEAMVKLASSEYLSPDINRLAAEFLVTLAENKPKMCKSNSDFVRSCIEILLKMMLNIKDQTIEEWSTAPESDEIENNYVAEEYLDRLSKALHGESIVPLIWNYIPQFIENSSWKYRCTALKSIAMIAEGSADVLLAGLNDIVVMLLRCVEDSDPRVRWDAIDAIGILADDFGPKFQTRFHEQVIPKLIPLLKDNFTKVQNHTAAAIVNFCQKFDSPLIEPYLNDLLTSLCQLLTTSDSNVQEQAIIAISTVASCAKKRFISYYNNLMPSLIDLFTKATDEKFRTLRGKTIACISSIAVAVGKEVFSKDSDYILSLIKTAQEMIQSPDDPLDDFIVDSWVNMAHCLGPDFAPYLDHVIPKLLEQANQEVDLILAPEGEEPGFNYYNLDEQRRVGVNMFSLSEKSRACTLISNYAMHVKEAFFPYVEQSSNILVPLLDYFFNEEVKLAAYSAMPFLIKSAKLYLTKNNSDMQLLHQLYNYIYTNVFDNLCKESDSASLLTALSCLAQCIEHGGENMLTNDQISLVFERIKSWVQEMGSEREELLEQIPDDDGEGTAFVREELGKETEFVSEIAEIVTSLVKYCKQSFMPLFVEAGMIDFTLNLIQNPRSKPELQLGVCFFDDLVEHTQEQSHALFGAFLPPILLNAFDEDPNIRQAITFGCGVFVQYGGSAVLPFLDQILKTLIDIITHPDSRNMTYGCSTENAVSSFGKIIQFQPQHLGAKLPEVIKMWLSWLPIEIDLVEAKVVHKQFCELVETNHANILGDGFQNLPTVLDIFSTLLSSRMIKKETNQHIISIIKGMQTKIPDVLSQAFSTLPQNKKDRFIRAGL